MSAAEVTVDELMAVWKDGGAAIVDVREPGEYVEAHIPGVQLIPMGSVIEQIDDIRATAPSTSCARSAGAAARWPTTSTRRATTSATSPAAPRHGFAPGTRSRPACRSSQETIMQRAAGFGRPLAVVGD